VRAGLTKSKPEIWLTFSDSAQSWGCQPLDHITMQAYQHFFMLRTEGQLPIS